MGVHRAGESGGWIGQWVSVGILIGGGDVCMGIDRDGEHGGWIGQWVSVRVLAILRSTSSMGGEQALSCYHATGNYAGLGQAGTWGRLVADFCMWGWAPASH